MKYLKKFENNSSYEEYILSEDSILPNVSYTVDTNEVFYNPLISNPSLYEWVDLGLPSGLKWAAWNVGAEKPEEYGLYFAWGETQGYSEITDTKKFNWSDYKFGKMDSLTKYNSTDSLIQLELIDDAAYQSDNTCRMPTSADFEELTANTTSTWETLNGINGRRFTSKINGSSIFLPAAGYCYNGAVRDVGSNGHYWSSSLREESDPNSGCDLFFLSGSVVMSGGYRRFGYSVRAVKE
jgi:hypothetical protein